MWPFKRKKDTVNQNCILVNIRCGYFRSKKEVDKALKKAFPFLTSKDIKTIHNVLQQGNSSASFRMFVPGSYVVRKEPTEGIRSTTVFGTDIHNCNCRGWVSGTCCAGPNFDGTMDYSVQLQGAGENAFPPAYQSGRHIHSDGDVLPIDREGMEHFRDMAKNGRDNDRDDESEDEW